jgi:hypothetical protein
VRVKVKDRIARVLFTIDDGVAVLLRGSIKKSPKMPAPDLLTAMERKRQLEREGAAH